MRLLLLLLGAAVMCSGSALTLRGSAIAPPDAAEAAAAEEDAFHLDRALGAAAPSGNSTGGASGCAHTTADQAQSQAVRAFLLSAAAHAQQTRLTRPPLSFPPLPPPLQDADIAQIVAFLGMALLVYECNKYAQGQL